MVEIDSISFQNFMSYGDYRTTIEIAGLGACLINGQNGAGKSTIINSMLYTLFGRTMHAARPGDRIINRQVGGGCLSSMRLKNGDVITRTRKLAGHNELVVQRGGEAVMSTLSTTPNQQAQLNKMYGLDWHTFCNTSFLTQIGRTWFEMPEPQRKKEIERAMRIDRLTLRAQVAKSKLETATRDQVAARQQYEQLDRQVAQAQADLTAAQDAEAGFEEARAGRFRAAIDQARAYKAQYDAAPAPDVEDIKSKWVAVDAARVKLAEWRSKAERHERQALSHDMAARQAQKSIDRWVSKSGAVCLECERDVPHAHADDKVAPYVAERDAKAAAAAAEREEAARASAKAERIAAAIAASQPAMSVREAEAAVRHREALLSSAEKWAAQAAAVKKEVSPHAATIERLRQRVAARSAERDAHGTDRIAELDTLVRHYSYIHRSYHDRRKIKSYSVAKFQPLLNSKLKHYLAKFRLNVDLRITESLGVETSGSDYEFMSGGERKRVDVSFMLARFAVHEHIYGRQSNVVVLDEVDGRMDEEGVECLVDIVLHDLAPRVDAVLVISHKGMMRDVFPKQISVEKHGAFSVLGR